MPISIVGQSGGPGRERKKHIGGLQQFEAAGENADDGVGAGVEIDRLAEDIGGSSEATLPQAITEQDDRSTALTIFISAKGATDAGVYAEQRKQRSSDHASIESLGLTGTGEGDRGGARGLQRFERAALIAPVDVILIRSTDYGVATLFGDDNQTRRIAKGEGPKKHRVDDTENGGVCTDAECEGQDSDCRERRTLEEQAKGVAKVLEKVFHLHSGRGSARHSFRRLNCRKVSRLSAGYRRITSEWT